MIDEKLQESKIKAIELANVVNQLSASVAGGSFTLAEAAKVQAEIKKLLDLVKESQTEVQKMFDHLRYSVVPALLEESGMEKATITGVGTVYLADDIRTGIKDKEQLFGVLKSHEMGDLIQETVNASTLKAVIREAMKEGNSELLQDIQDAVEVKPFSVARILSK